MYPVPKTGNAANFVGIFGHDGTYISQMFQRLAVLMLLLL